MFINSRAFFLVGVTAAALASCTVSDEKAGRLLAAPDRYVLYDCAQLANSAQAIHNRERKLEMLLAKAERDSVGVLVGSSAYRPEYTQLRGLMYELKKTAADKKCKMPPLRNDDPPTDNERNAFDPRNPIDPDIFGLPSPAGR